MLLVADRRQENPLADDRRRRMPRRQLRLPDHELVRRDLGRQRTIDNRLPAAAARETAANRRRLAQVRERRRDRAMECRRVMRGGRTKRREDVTRWEQQCVANGITPSSASRSFVSFCSSPLSLWQSRRLDPAFDPPALAAALKDRVDQLQRGQRAAGGGAVVAAAGADAVEPVLHQQKARGGRRSRATCPRPS